LFACLFGEGCEGNPSPRLPFAAERLWRLFCRCVEPKNTSVGGIGARSGASPCASCETQVDLDPLVTSQEHSCGAVGKDRQRGERHNGNNRWCDRLFANVCEAGW
jgi:hypothetical protein